MGEAKRAPRWAWREAAIGGYFPIALGEVLAKETSGFEWDFDKEGPRHLRLENGLEVQRRYLMAMKVLAKILEQLVYRVRLFPMWFEHGLRRRKNSF